MLANLDNAVAFSNVCQELVAESLALTGALHKASDVHKLDSSGHCLLGLGQICEGLEAFIWHCHNAHIGLDRAEREVRGLRLAVLAHGIEERRLRHQQPHSQGESRSDRNTAPATS